MLTQMANQPITWLLLNGIQARGCGEDGLLEFNANVRTEEERLAVTWLLSSVSQTDLLGSQPSPGFYRGQWPERENIQWAAAAWREAPC